MQTLLLPLTSGLYAVDIARVREVLAAPVFHLLPTAPSTVLGLINLRGEILPLFDTAALTAGARQEHPSFAVVVETDRGASGLASGGVPVMAELCDPVASSAGAFSAGTFSVGDQLATLVDVDRLLAQRVLLS